MAKETPYRVITGLLEGLGGIVPIISWGTSANPWYQQAPEPPPVFPYVVYDLPFSSIEHVQMSGAEGGAYAEKRVLSLSVYGDSDEIEQCAAPEWAGSLFNYLDSLADEPQFLNGLGFACIQFLRNGYELKLEQYRDETGVMRVWQAHASYDFWTTVPYPIRKT